MSVDIIPVLRKRSRTLLERHPEWRTAFILGSLVLFVAAAALPAEGRHGGECAYPCQVMLSDDPLLEAIAPQNR
ncbi:hypothetical protein OKA04_05765 [Luteolibacter flavescens]|uniref:ABC transporter permease n=1 Tax=Luteolibacter flavescens TaxID=1859460 RepID=A0ABT3FKX4_9BACT|nr:hypothetical protein [Luteolibacter flavescens]MCW1884229.1 hypothetical protein [Luteolibacter flavescens]